MQVLSTALSGLVGCSGLSCCVRPRHAMLEEWPQDLSLSAKAWLRATVFHRVGYDIECLSIDDFEGCKKTWANELQLLTMAAEEHGQERLESGR